MELSNPPLYQSEFNTSLDPLLYIDNKNPLITVNTSELGIFTQCRCVVETVNSRIEILPVQSIKGGLTINLLEIVEGDPFRSQRFSFELFVNNESLEKSIKSEIQYNFVHRSPIPFIAVIADSIPTDPTHVSGNFEFYDTPDKDGWYSIDGPIKKGKGRIHARGQGSLGFPKKSFTINLGKENPISILGMPESHKWLLIGGWVETSHLVNKVAYDIYAEMGNYGAQSDFVQLMINGTYWGLYTFGERIQRGRNHVDTRKKNNGGYIIKEVDSREDFCTASKRTFEFEYPDAEEIREKPELGRGILENVNRYEETVMCKGDWQEYLHQDAELDYFIVTDAFANGDSYYKDKNLFYFLNRDNKLEPVIWDFIWAFGAPYYTTNDQRPYKSWENIWGYKQELMYGNDDYGSERGQNRFELMRYYMQDPRNVNTFKQRYYNWRKGENGFAPVLGEEQITERVTQLIDLLRSGEVYELNATRWREEGKKDPNYGYAYSPEEILEKLLSRLNVMDEKVKKIEVASAEKYAHLKANK